MDYSDDECTEPPVELTLPVENVDDLPYDDCEEIGYIAFDPPVHMSLANILASQPLNVAGLKRIGEQALYDPVKTLWDKDSLDPHNLLLRAVHEHDPAMYVPYRTRIGLSQTWRRMLYVYIYIYIHI